MTIVLSLIVSIAMQAAAPSPLQVVARESMSQIEEPRQAVARNAAEWTALWRQHAGDRPAPKVDFGSRMVVALFLGTRPSAGYTAEVARVLLKDGALTIQWQERGPQGDTVSAQVLTTPAVMVSIPKFDGQVTFEKVER